MKGSGGTDGGVLMFFCGLALSLGGLYLLFDSVYVSTGAGIFSQLMGRNSGHGMGSTTSMGVLFLPFVIAVVGLFYDVNSKWAWILLFVGVGILGIEFLSHIRFVMRMKLTHLLMMLFAFAAGLGLMLRSYRSL